MTLDGICSCISQFYGYNAWETINRWPIMDKAYNACGNFGYAVNKNGNYEFITLKDLVKIIGASSSSSSYGLW